MLQLIGAAPEAYEAALMAAYPGRGNPVLDTLWGDISIRELRIMIQHLPADNAASRELHGRWDDLRWMIWDISTQLRINNTNTSNIYRKEGEPPITDPEYLPNPETIDQQPTTRPVEVVQAERQHLQDVLNRKKKPQL